MILTMMMMIQKIYMPQMCDTCSFPVFQDGHCDGDDDDYDDGDDDGDDVDALASHVGRPAILPEPRLDSLHGGVNTRTPLLQHFVKQIRRPRLAQRRPSKLRAMEPLQVRRKERHGRAILAET